MRLLDQSILYLDSSIGQSNTEFPRKSMLNLHVFMYEHGNGSTNHFGISLIEYYKKIYFEIYDEESAVY